MADSPGPLRVGIATADDAASHPEGGYEINMTKFAPQAEDLVVDTARRLIGVLQPNPAHPEPIPGRAQ